MPSDTPRRRAAAVLRGGGVVAYPTESCYGLGCDPRRAEAVARILRMKHRARAKGLILIADRRDRLIPYITTFAVPYHAQILASWPGPHTWLLGAAARAAPWLRGRHRTIAVRVTAHPEAAALCRVARMPLVSTSANRSGRRPLRSHAAVQREFGAEVDFVMPGRIGGAAAPSIIRDGESGQVVRG